MLNGHQKQAVCASKQCDQDSCSVSAVSLLTISCTCFQGTD